MGKVDILDCTLRDGGYCNDFVFGYENIREIIINLVNAQIDIIECGFLTNSIECNKNSTKYNSLKEISSIIPPNHMNSLFVCMINYGEYDLKDIPMCGESSIDGMRIAFHKKDMIPALKFCEGIKKKGYKVFVQAMISLDYNDNEFLDLICLVNSFSPYAFYIVDSFGIMKRKDLIRLFYLVEHNLKENILIGYHSHNNMQLAYSNAQALIDINTKRDLILDASVFGMGRGAGNLNTELLVEYLNDNVKTKYILKPLLDIIDEFLIPIYQQSFWGYSLPNFLSAKHNVHPNYSKYLDSKKTLTVGNMDEIFSMIEESKRLEYDEQYIKELYIKYLAVDRAQESRLFELHERILNKNILIIAPGRTSIEEKDTIVQCAQRRDVITISVNFEYSECETDFIFISNIRRFNKLNMEKYKKCIITSNIQARDVYLQVQYRDLLNGVEAVRDNACLMLIRFLIRMKTKKVLLAGVDGYSVDPLQNFADSQMNFFTMRSKFDEMNEGLSQVLREYGKQIEIEYITTKKFLLH